MHVNLVDEAGTDQLLADLSAHDVDILVTCGGSRSLDSFLGTVNERIHASVWYLLGLAVRDDEQRSAHRAAGAIGAPPGHRQVVSTPADDARADTAAHLGQDLR